MDVPNAHDLRHLLVFFLNVVAVGASTKRNASTTYFFRSFFIMKKGILITVAILGVTSLFIAGAYYIAIYLPQKQQTSMNIVKLELEAKIQQEKTEQLKIDQDNKAKEEEKQASLKAEAEKQEATKVQQQRSTSSSISKCLANADASYQEKAAKIKYPSDNANTILSILSSNRIQARNECYK